MKRKVISILLILAMLLSVAAIPTGAVQATEKHIPHINIHGFMCCPLYADKNNPESDKIWPPSGKTITKAVFKLMPELVSYFFTRDKAGLMEGLIPQINAVFDPLMCGSDGKPVIKTSGAYQPRPTTAQIDADPTIEYAYDWRLDPLDVAAELNDFINYLCDDLGYGQVCVECHSNGGTILLSYFAQYGTSKVRSCCFSATAVYGAGFAAELIEGRVQINGEGLEEYLINVLANNERAALIEKIVKTASRMKLLNGVTNLLNGAINAAHDKFYADCVFPIFGNWLNIWAMVPDNSVDNGINYCKNNFGFDTEGEYKAFFDAVNNYTDIIRKNREQILEKINADCNLYVFCFYNLPGVPIAADWNTMSDGILYSADTSFGASFKNFIDLSTFEPGDYVSPDGRCDGSTAKFRDQTWYFRDCNHLLKNEYLNTMAKELLYYDGQATVKTFTQYPQFLKFDPFVMNIVAA